MWKAITLINAAVLLATGHVGIAHVTAQSVSWLDVSEVSATTVVTTDHPVLGSVRVTASPAAQATFPVGPGFLGELSWLDFDYINYDASQSGTNAPISGSMTFEFLDGPIDAAVTPIYFTSNGLHESSSYVVDNEPIYLGDISIAEGTGTHTSLGGGRLRIEGAGWNHNPDLFEFSQSSISSITVEINQVEGDGAGFTIGASSGSVVGVNAIRSTRSKYLGGNQPNPFNPRTMISYKIPLAAHVSLKIYDVSGALVRVLVDREQTPRSGGYVVPWDGKSDRGRSLPSGAYFYELRTGIVRESNSMILVR